MEEIFNELIERSFWIGMIAGAILTTLVSRFVLLRFKKRVSNQMFMLNTKIVELYRLRQEEKQLDKQIEENRIKA